MVINKIKKQHSICYQKYNLCPHTIAILIITVIVVFIITVIVVFIITVNVIIIIIIVIVETIITIIIIKILLITKINPHYYDYNYSC